MSKAKERITVLEDLIHLVPAKDGHIKILCKINGKVFTEKTSIRNELTKFEQRAVIVHVYKTITECTSKRELRHALRSINYADVFGSRWSLDLTDLYQYR